MVKLTQPTTKIVGKNGYVSQVFDVDEKALAKAEYSEIFTVLFWLEFEEVWGQELYYLKSEPKDFAIGYRSFSNMEEAIQYFLDKII